MSYKKSPNPSSKENVLSEEEAAYLQSENENLN